MIPTQFTNPENFRYNSVTPECMVECTDRFIKNFETCKDFIKSIFHEYSMEMRISYPIIYRIVERIDQRSDYYLYFHSRPGHPTLMSQAKEVALFCYWLIKYKPISFEKAYEEYDFFFEHGYSVNEFYAAFLLMSFITGLEVNNLKYFHKKAIFDLTYSLANREISKESLILYVESFIKHDPKMENNHV